MLLFFKRYPYDSDFWPFSLGDLNIILGTFRFFIKLPRKLRSAFPLKLRFLEIRLLVTWLKWQLEIFSPSLLGTVLKDQNHHTPQIYYPSSTSSLVTALFLTLITLKNTVFFFLAWDNNLGCFSRILESAPRTWKRTWSFFTLLSTFSYLNRFCLSAKTLTCFPFLDFLQIQTLSHKGTILMIPLTFLQV